MNYYILISLIIAWIVVVLFIHYRYSRITIVDSSHVRNRFIFRIFSILILSIVVYLALNPSINGTILSFGYYPLVIIWFLSVIGGMASLYNILGPILSKKFVSQLKTDNYAIYLRGFSSEKNKIVCSTEKELCDFLQKGIPVFAIGDPSTVLSNVGADRLYATDEEWEEIVIELIGKGKLVIVRPSSSDGCLKELHHIINLKILSKCLFIVSSKEDIMILRHHLKVQDMSHLEHLERTLLPDKVYGLKIDPSGNFSSFMFESNNENILNFLILYGIEIDGNAKLINLSFFYQMLDRVAFVLNPLFYASLFRWGLLHKILVTLLMLSPIILSYAYSHKMSPEFSMRFLFAAMMVLMFYVARASKISQSRKQYASTNHYMNRVVFLICFNLIFIVLFVIALLNKPEFSRPFRMLFQNVMYILDIFLKLILLLFSFPLNILTVPLFIILTIVLISQVKKRKK